MSNASSFIDQNLAAQLFVAARAHDSLRDEFDDILPRSVNDLFPNKSGRSNRYRTATYSALAKSQQNNNPNHEEKRHNRTHDHEMKTESNSFKELLKENNIMKKITAFLGRNDKTSLIFALSEDFQDDEEVNEKQGSSVKNTSTSLAEDLYLRELEDLDITREKFLLQLITTRELEAKRDDSQHLLDRTRNICSNPVSGDLILLNFLATRLQLLREFTAGDDFFNGRAHYSSWCLHQHALIIEKAKSFLAASKLAFETNQAIREESLHFSRTFLKDVAVDSCGDDSFLAPKRRSSVAVSANRRTSVTTNTLGGDGNSTSPQKRNSIITQRRGTVSATNFSMPSAQLIDEYKNRSGSIIAKHNLEMAGEISRQSALLSLKESSKGKLSPNKNLLVDSNSYTSDNTPTTIGHAVTLRVNFGTVCNEEDAFSVMRSMHETRSSLGQEEQKGVNDSYCSASDQKQNSISDRAVDDFRRHAQLGIEKFETKFCDHLESISNRSLLAVQRKYMTVNDTADIPSYVKDMKWNIAEKYALVACGSDNILDIKNRLAADFEERLLRANEAVMQQQIRRLTRMQDQMENC